MNLSPEMHLLINLCCKVVLYTKADTSSIQLSPSSDLEEPAGHEPEVLKGSPESSGPKHDQGTQSLSAYSYPEPLVLAGISSWSVADTRQSTPPLHGRRPFSPAGQHSSVLPSLNSFAAGEEAGGSERVW